MIRYGYACHNLSLGIRPSRDMIYRTFRQKGLEYVSQLAIKNLQDHLNIIHWNNIMGIGVYRCSGSIFPWMTHYELEDLPHYDEIRDLLMDSGTAAHKYGQRLSFHPGPFVQLGSPTENVVENSINELRKHGEMMDLMNQDRSPLAKINIHIGAKYGDMDGTLDRWVSNFWRLPDSVRSRLVIENDDKPGMYSVDELYHHLRSRLDIPLTFDYHHYYCNPGNMDLESALKACLSTWPVRPTVHYSSSLQNEKSNVKKLAHAFFIYEEVPTFGQDMDIVFECKGKDLGLLDYFKKFDKKAV